MTCATVSKQCLGCQGRYAQQQAGLQHFQAGHEDVRVPGLPVVAALEVQLGPRHDAPIAAVATPVICLNSPYLQKCIA